MVTRFDTSNSTAGVGNVRDEWVWRGKGKRGAFWDEITEIMFWKGGAAKGITD